MKKILYYVFLVIAMLMLIDLVFPKLRNSNPEDELLSKAEKELKLSMNDNDSYEFISFEKDYTYSDSLRKQDYLFFKEEKINPNNDYHLLTFRGTNKMGVKIIDEVIVKSSDNVFLEIIDVK